METSDRILEKRDLEKDNVSTDEVVEVIKQHREEKIKYTRWDPNSYDVGESVRKINEIGSILRRASNEKEWQKTIVVGIATVFRMKIEDTDVEIEQGNKIPFSKI